jgi:hypothetical protein
MTLSKNSQACASGSRRPAKCSLTSGQCRLIAPASGSIMTTSPMACGLASTTVRGAFTHKPDECSV